MAEIIWDVLLDAFIDNIKILPILFITYLLMESVEHHTSKRIQKAVKSAGKVGPLFGGVLGVIPQCGFSGAASNFYAGRIISVGTLIAIYLSTSDEMLPILISEAVSIKTILAILGMKLVIGVAAGFIIDFIVEFNKPVDLERGIEEMCKHDHCNCERGVFRSALLHTLQIFAFLLAVTIVLGFTIELAGEDVLSNIILNVPVLGEMLAGLIGLIPNCASSVIITKLYVNGTINLGVMMSGLLVNAGVGLLVLYRVNRKLTSNLKITGALYVIGVIAGIIITMTGISL